MPRTITTARKVIVGMAWPARLDQELRKRFGEDLKPKTFFDKEERNAYVTSFDLSVLDEMQVAQVRAYIAGFQACVEMVTE